MKDGLSFCKKVTAHIVFLLEIGYLDYYVEESLVHKERINDESRCDYSGIQAGTVLFCSN